MTKSELRQMIRDAILEEERNYKREYENYHAKPEQKKRRAERNASRRKKESTGAVRKGDGKDVHHRDGNTKNQSSSNLAVLPKSKNRAMKEHGEREMKKSQLRQLIREEIRFTLMETRLPPSIEDVTMTMLHTGMNKAVIRKLDDIKNRVGDNANPISIQVMEAWNDVRKKMLMKGNLKGEDAVRHFFSVALKEFNSDFSFIRSLSKKYGIRDPRRF